MGNDFTPFRNIINDWYAKNISSKTKAVLKARAAAGKYLSSGIYGYRKDPNNKNRLIPGPETAPVVKRIFNMTASGYSFRSIVSNEGILTPAARKNIPPRSTVSRPTDWNTSTLGDMIRNPEYFGMIVYGKSRKVSYKSKKLVAVPEV